MELPIPNKVKKLWDSWHLRGLIILSLFLQSFLVLFGWRRQRSKSTFLLFFIWSAYLLADWVATVAIGAIIKTQTDLCDQPKGGMGDDLLAFWASFLLLHLGGPDSITSYALEDNEFWLRHFLGLVLQAMAAAYSLYLTIPTNKLWLPSVLVFVVGIFKYGERTYALYLPSFDSFGSTAMRDSSLTRSGKPMVPISTMQQQASSTTILIPPAEVLKLPDLKNLNDMQLLEVACKLFGHFKGLFVDRFLSLDVRSSSRSTFLEADHTSAFKVVENELSILYEALHTKVIVACRTLGFTLRFISFCAILGASLLFLFTEKHGDDLDKFDIKITYALLICAIVLDFMSFVQIVSSDWSPGALKGTWRRYIPSIIFKRRRWSESISQYNMISYCLDERPMSVFYNLAGYCHAREIAEKIKISLFSSSEKVTDELKKLVFNELRTKSEKKSNAEDVLTACVHRGHCALSSPRCSNLQWSVKMFEYEETLLLWHLATELCYHNKETKDKEAIAKTKGISKVLSDYMFYLLVMQPSMLSPVLGNWNVVFQDTCEEANRFFHKFDKISLSSSSSSYRGDYSKACEKLLSVETKSDKLAAAVKQFKSKSVLFDSCYLAKELQKMEDQWEVMDRMWVELMCYAAINCLPIVHAQQPSKGGELWTITWLLMNHLGLGLQFLYMNE
ncbi:uncharacterized protein LOC133831407 [Humulus lupulus]|uniref:uncharacterized protein LOC133831407 n=1 Tax=Humulus lupulus TaxID=3486 RepID=UPI002B410783|nr:uncharacterized protein LOC133831407 [Humulus lupulus]